MSDGRATSPTYADVTRDVARTLEPPGNLYFSWMSVVALILTAGILAWAGQIWWGMGMAGKRVPQMWAMYITSFVFWIGRSEEHTSELQSLRHLVCRLLL